MRVLSDEEMCPARVEYYRSNAHDLIGGPSAFESNMYKYLQILRFVRFTISMLFLSIQPNSRHAKAYLTDVILLESSLDVYLQLICESAGQLVLGT